jgi:hypothetical protein
MDWSFARPVVSIFVASSYISVAVGCTVRHSDNVEVDGVLPLHVSEAEKM